MYLPVNPKSCSNLKSGNQLVLLGNKNTKLNHRFGRFCLNRRLNGFEDFTDKTTIGQFM
jgi:hypothetical protein